MRILYGVVGEGMGHATRSRVVLEHLLGAGHELHIMASGRAREFLAKRFTLPATEEAPVEGGSARPSSPSADRPSRSGVRAVSPPAASSAHPPSKVQGIHGFFMITEENRVMLGKTLLSNVVTGTVGLPKNIAAYFALLTKFRPEVVISDFESWTYLFAKMHGLPILSIDNMQIINRCAHEPDILAGHEASFALAKTFVKSKLPFCNDYFITTFFRPPTRKPDTRLFPPILRPEILAAPRGQGARREHLLVYQTAEGNDELAATLTRSGFPCRVYGMRRKLTEDVVEANLTYRPFSEAGFIDDLASARAVIAGGGFTLMGEAVYLRKPMLSVPLAAQFEQVMNARYLQKVHYGRMAESLADPREIETFLRELPTFEAALASYDQDGNRELFGAVDEWLDKAEAGVA